MIDTFFSGLVLSVSIVTIFNLFIHFFQTRKNFRNKNTNNYDL